ncbi:hypothetical protein INR49_001907 [Caranx melampygus]|nr:hypothetical protein INR49_001907 [Caranx melampygus]
MDQNLKEISQNLLYRLNLSSKRARGEQTERRAEETRGGKEGQNKERNKGSKGGGFEQDVENGYHQHPDTCHGALPARLPNALYQEGSSSLSRPITPLPAVPHSPQHGWSRDGNAAKLARPRQRWRRTEATLCARGFYPDLHTPTMPQCSLKPPRWRNYHSVGGKT